MQGQRRRARLDEPRPDLQADARAVLKAAPHLHRDRDRDRLRDRLHDPAGAPWVVQERRPGARLRHLPDRAAEVDVHQVGPGRLDHPRRLGHHRRLRSEDLDRQGMLVPPDT